jgi:hypothetical protein
VKFVAPNVCRPYVECCVVTAFIIKFFCPHVCTNNCTIIRYIGIQIYDKPPTCFGLFWPCAGMYSKKENAVMAVNVTDVQ